MQNMRGVENKHKYESRRARVQTSDKSENGGKSNIQRVINLTLNYFLGVHCSLSLPSMCVCACLSEYDTAELQKRYWLLICIRLLE